MNRNTKARLRSYVKEQKRLGKRTSGFKARKTPFPKHDKRPDLAWTYGYDGTGKYIGKLWAYCY